MQNNKKPTPYKRMKRTPLRLIEQASFHPFYIQSLPLSTD
ncbi:hypothetical protein HMPREF9151_02574 [Hoylesella saccharolytica F0055]|uniref:Uncharacterized protein n=1 Tax=Hoylesella saccharolytica F0055 TaxID=1127699 RepID=L1MY91_9BACT|nr:hypothetical protein HMPREF9151_02574 [Hoylesella saccharolytica F0055]